jgi:tripartite-type tricarboxylate transporter receptor subunit TctC
MTSIGPGTHMPNAGSEHCNALGAAPDIPTVGETVPGEANSWSGIGVPRGAPPEVIEKLSREINTGLTNPSIKARLAEVGAKLSGAKPE